MVTVDLHGLKNQNKHELTLDENSTLKDIQIKIGSIYKVQPNQVSLFSSTDKSSRFLDSSLQLKKTSNFSSKKTVFYFTILCRQVPYRLTYIVEYISPLVFYWIFRFVLSLSFNGSFNVFRNKATIIPDFMFTLHFLKRIYESIHVHIFSNETMPLKNLIINSFGYSTFGAMQSISISNPRYFQKTGRLEMFFFTICFMVAEFGNFQSHALLASYRRGTANSRTQRFIIMPRKTLALTFLFNFVNSAHYTYEIFSWIFFWMATRTIASFLFVLSTILILTNWGSARLKKNREACKDFPKDRKAVIPFLL